MAAMQNKRKRESQDIAGGRAAPGMNQGGNGFEQHYLQTDDDGMNNLDFADALVNTGADPTVDAQHSNTQMQSEGGRGGSHNATDAAAAAMAQAAAQQYHTMTVPQSTEQSFMAQPTEGGDRVGSVLEQATPSSQHRNSSFSDFDVSGAQSSPNGNPSPSGATSTPLVAKPSVGSAEWHQIRKDNHKEVERRRRETINEGINELAKIVPGCEKNKGSILARAVQFITQLKENETQNIEKWTLEKLLTEQAIAELSSSCDKLKAECQRAWSECEQWKKAAQKAGVALDDDDKGDADGEEAD